MNICIFERVCFCVFFLCVCFFYHLCFFELFVFCFNNGIDEKAIEKLKRIIPCLNCAFFFLSYPIGSYRVVFFCNQRYSLLLDTNVGNFTGYAALCGPRKIILSLHIYIYYFIYFIDVPNL